MKKAEEVGHVAVITLAGSLGLFWGLKGVILGLIIVVSWILYTRND